MERCQRCGGDAGELPEHCSVCADPLCVKCWEENAFCWKHAPKDLEPRPIKARGH